MTFKHQAQSPPVIWVVVADRSRARILSASWPEPKGWQEVADLVHSEGSLRAGEVETDRQGTFGEGRGRHHKAEPHTDFKHQTAERFAGDIVDYLEGGRTQNKFGKLALVCSPLFLGVLRNALPSPLAKHVILELDQDYTHAPLKELSGHLDGAITESQCQ